MVSIIIPTSNNLENDLKPCIESIKKYTDLSKVNIIIVANGCNDGTEDYVNSLGHPFHVISYPERIGYAKAINAGIKNAIGDYVILLNDDTILIDQPTDSWINLLKEPFLRDSKIGITGPHRIQCPISGYPFIVFFCVMISRDLKNAIGILDESYEVGGYEDADYCIRAENAGFRVAQIGQNYSKQENKIIGVFPIYHKGEDTVKSIPDWNNIFHKNQTKFWRKYFLDKPLISVVIPTRIGDKLECISHLEAQTYGNLEIIVINDFNRKGAAFCRNKGILKASGEYILFSDADICWYSHSIETLYDALKDNEEASYSYGGFSALGSDGCLTTVEPMFMKEFNVEDLRKSNYITMCSLVRKSDISLLDESLAMFEDWDLWLTMLDRGRTGIFCGKEVFYTKHRYGTSARSDSEYWLEKVRSKHSDIPKTLKLNLGCGDMILDGYVNCDLYDPAAQVKCDAAKLPYPDNSVDEIYASHIIEHFHFWQSWGILKEWKRVLKHGGRLIIETPDFEASCKKFIESNEVGRINMYSHFFSVPKDPGQVHLFLYTPTQLKWALEQIKMDRIEKIPALRYIDAADQNMKFICIKP